MSNIEKIRAEIERLYGEYKDKFHRSGDSYHLGLIDGLDMAERVLDTFSEEPATNGYDEAYLNEKIAKASKTWEGVDVDKYMDEVRGREPDKSLEEAAERFARFYDQGTCDGIIQDGFVAGAEWQKEQMGEQARQALAKTDITLADLVAFDEGCTIGRRLERQQMLKDAVEGEVYDYGGGSFGLIARWLDMPNEPVFKGGEKVRIVVLKAAEG